MNFIIKYSWCFALGVLLGVKGVLAFNGLEFWAWMMWFAGSIGVRDWYMSSNVEFSGGHTGPLAGHASRGNGPAAQRRRAGLTLT